MEYVEECKNINMLSTEIFLKMLVKTQTLLPTHQGNGKKLCKICNDTQYYRLSHIIWPKNMIHLITDHHMFPSEYFVNVITNLCIINNKIMNPPIELPRDMLSNVKYIRLRYNQLLIIDALMENGSEAIYEHDGRKLYSEHAGVINIKNDLVESVSVSTNTNRVDDNDGNIFLPQSEKTNYEFEYMFHTHPNTNTNGERMKSGILYEFPSSNDIFYFVQCHNNGRSQGSIVVAPEGTYVVRPVKYAKKIKLGVTNADLNANIIKIERAAHAKNKHLIDKFIDPDTFHKHVSYNFDYIKMYNSYLHPHNIFIEYYPRIKLGKRWALREIGIVKIEN